MVEQVTMIGDGQMATVCSIMLADLGVHVRMWGHRREQIEALATDVLPRLRALRARSKATPRFARVFQSRIFRL